MTEPLVWGTFCCYLFFYGLGFGLRQFYDVAGVGPRTHDVAQDDMESQLPALFSWLRIFLVYLATVKWWSGQSSSNAGQGLAAVSCGRRQVERL